MTLKGKGLLSMQMWWFTMPWSVPTLMMINRKKKIHAGKRRGVIPVQDEITQLLIEKAQTNAVVVRLKGRPVWSWRREMEDLVKLGYRWVWGNIWNCRPAYGIPDTSGPQPSVTFGHRSRGSWEVSTDCEWRSPTAVETGFTWGFTIHLHC